MGDEMLSSSNLTSPNETAVSAETKVPGSSDLSTQLPVDPKDLQGKLDQANQRIKRFEDWQNSVLNHVTGKSPHDPGPWKEQEEESAPKAAESLPNDDVPPRVLFDDTALTNEYRQRYPDLVPYEDYIALDAMTLVDRAALKGQSLSMRSALDVSIKRFQEKLQAQEAKVQQATRQQVRSQAVKQQALQLDAGGSQPKPKTGAEAIWAMSNEEFAKYKEEQLKKAYGL